MSENRKYIPEPDFPECKRDSVSGVWYLIARYRGRRIKKTTEESESRARAIKIAKELHAEFLTEDVDKQSARFHNVHDEVLTIKKNASRSTWKTYQYIQDAHLLPFFGNKLVRKIIEDDWFKYVELERQKYRVLKTFHHRGKEIKRTTLLPSPAHPEITIEHIRGFEAGLVKKANRHLDHDWRYFNEVMRRAFERGYMRIRIRVPNPDPTDAKGREYSDDEVERLLSNANEDLRLQIQIATTQGNRKNEILKARWYPEEGIPVERQKYPWFELTAGKMHIPSLAEKRRMPRVVSINRAVVLPKLKERFLAKKGPYVFHHPDTPEKPLGTNAKAWKACKRRAGVIGKFHWLRHTCATRLARAGHNRHDIGTYLGMSPEILSEIYRHLNDDEQVKIAETVTIPLPSQFRSNFRKRPGKVVKL